LLDGAKSLYSPILSLLEGRLCGGALIVADNADDSPEYLARVRSARGDYLSVPFADDVELSMRLESAAPGDVPTQPADASSSARGADGPA
jgi:predicted O-methyltransferase YrrM